jgi:hypothetical protein
MVSKKCKKISQLQKIIPDGAGLRRNRANAPTAFVARGASWTDIWAMDVLEFSVVSFQFSETSWCPPHQAFGHVGLSNRHLALLLTHPDSRAEGASIATHY